MSRFSVVPRDFFLILLIHNDILNITNFLNLNYFSCFFSGQMLQNASVYKCFKHISVYIQ